MNADEQNDERGRSALRPQAMASFRFYRELVSGKDRNPVKVSYCLEYLHGNAESKLSKTITLGFDSDTESELRADGMADGKNWSHGMHRSHEKKYPAPAHHHRYIL